MAVKTVHLDGIGTANIYKRRGNSSIRLGFDSSGNIRVTQPAWLPYEASVKFVKERKDWILAHQPTPNEQFVGGEKVGKAHHVRLIPSDQVKGVTGRINGGVIQIKYPSHLDVSSHVIQKRITDTAKKALLAEAKALLPQRLASLASKYSFSYNDVSIKQLKSKWGSCNQNHEITLNYYLMQLPWELIDYVLIHELVHTEHLNHSTEFWQRFEQVLPNAKKIRKELKSHKTIVVQAT